MMVLLLRNQTCTSKQQSRMNSLKLACIGSCELLYGAVWEKKRWFMGQRRSAKQGFFLIRRCKSSRCAQRKLHHSEKSQELSSLSR
mmetsp:Transcript_16109/g.23823  ORF Transcript_16109/g.23823 Transcript_16109/m.23823 type:complete len:86 (+) Transcript_16109:223-480(+)